MSNARGRQPVSVNQPPHGGMAYPFVRTNADVKYLLADLYLIYDDRLEKLKPPFRISKLFGFGGLNVSIPAEYVSKVGEKHVVIVDKNSVEVFDTLQAEHHQVVLWPQANPRMQINQWGYGDKICRLVHHLQWQPEDEENGVATDYPIYVETEDGELDHRTVCRMPPRVRSIKVGGQTFTGKFHFVSGYNVQWVQPDEDDDIEGFRLLPDDIGNEVSPTAISYPDGTRLSNKIRIDSEPGLGFGVFPGCEELEPQVKLIAGAKADAAGNINIDMDGCLKVGRPHLLTTEDPRVFQYSSEGKTEAQAAATLSIGNDCKPCSDCDYYVRVYKGLSRQWDRWKVVTQKSEEARDTHRANIDRWLAAKACREANPLKLAIQSQSSCNVAAAALYCNVAKCCAKDVTMRFTFEFFRGSQPTTPSAEVCGGVEVEGSIEYDSNKDNDQAAVYTLSGTYPVYEVTFPYANPHDTSKASFRICLPACQQGDSIRMWVSIHFPDLEPNADGVECVSPEITVPAELQAIWDQATLPSVQAVTRAAKASNLIPLNSLSAYCEQCSCE